MSSLCRWVDAKNEEELEAWGTAPDTSRQHAFDPSSAYAAESASDAGDDVEDSDSNRSGNGWQMHQVGSETWTTSACAEAILQLGG